MEHDHHSAENIIALYNQGADEWDKVRKGNCIELTWLERYRALLPKAGQILDLGCGGGDPIARYFSQLGYLICGVDSSVPLLERCRERLPQGEWHLADMRTFKHESRFEGIIAWDSFFHLTRSAQREMFPLFGLHSQPGAVLMFTSGHDNGEAIGEFLGQPLYHSSLAHDEYHRLLKEQGYTVVKQITKDELCGGRTIWLAQRR